MKCTNNTYTMENLLSIYFYNNVMNSKKATHGNPRRHWPPCTWKTVFVRKFHACSGGAATLYIVVHVYSLFSVHFDSPFEGAQLCICTKHHRTHINHSHQYNQIPSYMCTNTRQCKWGLQSRSFITNPWSGPPPSLSLVVTLRQIFASGIIARGPPGPSSWLTSGSWMDRMFQRSGDLNPGT